MPLEGKETIFSLADYIVNDLPQTNRRQLTPKECQMLLSLLPPETLQTVCQEKGVEGVNELYEECLTHLLG